MGTRHVEQEIPSHLPCSITTTIATRNSTRKHEHDIIFPSQSYPVLLQFKKKKKTLLPEHKSYTSQ
jgi:hypothetical protein